MRKAFSHRRRRRGAVLVEAAIVLPLVMLFIFGIMEYGRYLMAMHLLNNAAREGAAYAAKHTSPIVLDGVTYGNADADVTRVVNSVAGGQSLDGQTISIYRSDGVGNSLGVWTGAQAGQYVCCEISGIYRFSVPTLLSLPASIATTVKSVKRSEGN